MCFHRKECLGESISGKHLSEERSMNYRLGSLVETRPGKPIAYIFTYIYCMHIYIYTLMYVYMLATLKGPPQSIVSYLHTSV